jgi:micrococcal nuclease
MQKLLLTILLLSSISLNISCNSRSGNRKSEAELLTVTKIIDGDTFWADNGTEKGIKIRLIGVDAPESRKTFKKEVGYFGKEAKEYLKNLLTDEKVKLEFDVTKTDQYGRTLAYVYLEDGTFVNAELVKNGFAMVMTVPPNVKYADLFLKLQQDARETNRGLWNIEYEN